MTAKQKQRLIDYLEHIEEAIQRITRYVSDMDELSFLDDELVQDAIIRNMEIIGEASNRVLKAYPEFVEKHPDAPFLEAYEMRNALAHGYFQIDLQIVWTTIERELPGMEVMIAEMKNTVILSPT